MNVAGLAASTRYDFAALTLYVPESTSRTFRSVFVEVTADQTDTAATSLTSWLIGVQLAAVAFSDVTVTDTITNTAEASTWKFLSGNLASYFNTNFGAGTSQTCSIGVSFGAVATRNICVRILITYEFDDSAQTTRIKTVRIPLDCSTTTLTSTLAEIGTTNQIPILTGGGSPYLAENTPTVRAIYMITEYANATTVTTDFQVGTQIDAATEVLSGTIENGLASSTFHRHIWSLAGLDTTAAHAWKMRATTTALMCWQQCTLVVTYEYNHSSTTRTTNHRYIPVNHTAMIASTAQGANKLRLNLQITEPGTLTLKQSGLVLWFASNNANNLTIAVNAQADRTYTHTQGTTVCGDSALSHRLDASAVAGTGGLTLAYGKNVIDVEASVANTGTALLLSGFVLLNYESDVHPDGVDVHSHSTAWILWDAIADGTSRYGAQVVDPNIPETLYRVDAVGVNTTLSCSANGFGAFFDVRVETGDWGSAWRRVYSIVGNNGGELSTRHQCADASQWFKRNPSDYDTDRISVETASRQWRLFSTAAIYSMAALWIDYSAMTYTVAGTVNSYTGDGSGITVDIIDPDGVKVNSATTSAGGGYTAEVYDARPLHKAIAQQDSTHAGRSANGTPA